MNRYLLAGLGLSLSVAGIAFAANEAAPPLAGDPHMGMHQVMRLPATRAEVKAQVDAHFAALDRNHDGFVTPDELPMRAMADMGRGGMRGSAPNKDALDHMFAMMDKDGNGQISKAEFDAFHADGMHMRHSSHEEHGPGTDAGMHDRRDMMVAMLFRHADANQDGKVSRAEAEAAALARFDRADTDHDGVLSEAERDAVHTHMSMRMHRGMPGNKGDMPPPPPGPPPQN